jgi:hypothetical protein
LRVRRARNQGDRRHACHHTPHVAYSFSIPNGAAGCLFRTFAAPADASSAKKGRPDCAGRPSFSTIAADQLL